MKNFNTRNLAGIIVLGIGLLVLLNNLGITRVSLGPILRTYWPILLISWGLVSIWNYFAGPGQDGNIKIYKSRGDLVVGFLVAGIGLAYLGRNLEWFEIDLSIMWNLFWPVIIILFGLSLIRGRASSPGSKNHWAFMGGIDVGKGSDYHLQGGNYLAFMGGIDLDLTRARLSQEETVLDLTAVMGGIDVKVPDNINVTCEGMALLGGIDFFNESTGGIFSSKKFERFTGEQNPTVYISCRNLMGGITVYDA